MTRLAVLSFSVLLAACVPAVCGRYCPDFQTLILVDAAGNPLTPTRVVDPRGEVHSCVEDDFVTCTDNRITFDQRDFAIHQLRVEAASGEVFNGDFTPTREPTGMESMGCDCIRDTRFADQTLQLRAP